MIKNAFSHTTTLVILLTFLLSINLKAQEVKQETKPTKADSMRNTRAQNVYAEAFGPGVFFTANYDTRFARKRDGMGMRAGIGYFVDNGDSFLTVPVQLNYLLGKKDKYFEIGFGATLITYKSNSHDRSFNTLFLTYDGEDTHRSSVFGSTTFGYRYQPADDGFSFRVSFNPLFNSSNFLPYGAVSFGYTFSGHYKKTNKPHDEKSKK